MELCGLSVRRSRDENIAGPEGPIILGFHFPRPEGRGFYRIPRFREETGCGKDVRRHDVWKVLGLMPSFSLS